MTSTKSKILKMVAEGKIKPEDGEELMGAMGRKTRFRWRCLLNPFDRMPDIPGVFVSLIVAVLSVVVGVWLKIRFDGALDVHAASAPVGMGQAVLDQGVAWIGFSLVLWGTSLIFAKQGRFVDFLITVGVSRIALLPIGVITGVLFPDPNVLVRIVMSTPYHPMVLLIALVGIVFMVWFVTWLFQGFKTASGLAKGRLIVAFVVAIIAAEALSKLALLGLPAVF